MTLEDYLKEKYPDMKPYAADAAFARKIETSRQNITRYRLYEHFPTPKMIARIRTESKGLVDANDHMPPELRAGYRGAKKARA
ncbi:hypothetical protein [Bradyrhizobium erythrophlei]|uniref:Uncharacterized protein n=1 Tax=Bradyrhizobium erythrophlei TaxID=1437360 RepID=A0A1M5NEJ2_9BRAD|nr:hypothetical protein [Bradyrhizobium erythrophlei]SHG87393.1 hypothetical protein SAMN05443248_2942 [Bradyrhizobium erythrophlei]